MKQPADNHLQSETGPRDRADIIDTSGYAYVYGGFIGMVVTPEVLRKANEAQARFNERKDNDRRPPKPPSRPNARIGGLALGNT